MQYDKNNIFYKIINREIPSKVVLENQYALCFQDIHPRDKLHLLIIPKGEYTNGLDFINRCSKDELSGFWQLVNDVSHVFHISNFKWESNGGSYADVPHFHLHLMSKDKND
jgi:histidine triad (HIT) family protein